MSIQKQLSAAMLERFNAPRPVTVHPEQHITFPNSVPANYLGACPRAKALERRAVEMTHPETHWRNSPTAAMRMGAGKDAEKRLIEAAVQKWGEDRVSYGITYSSKKLHLHGRVDMLIEMDDGRHAFEIKKTETYAWGKTVMPDGSKPQEPMFKYVWQALGYAIMTGYMTHIVVMTDKSLDVWTLRRVANGYRVFYDDTDILMNHPFNDPAILNQNTIATMTRQFLHHMDMELDDLWYQTPIQDPLNGGDNNPLVGDAWQCVKITDKPTRTKAEIHDGSARIACPYFCHTALLGPGDNAITFNQANRVVPVAMHGSDLDEPKLIDKTVPVSDDAEWYY